MSDDFNLNFILVQAYMSDDFNLNFILVQAFVR